MGLFDDLLSPVTSVVNATTRLTAKAVAATLAVPIALVEEALDAGCKTVDDVRRYVRKHR